MELNKECIALLRWIEKQPEPPTEEDMKSGASRVYSSDRVKWLLKNGFLLGDWTVQDNVKLGTYALSETARSEIQTRQTLSRKSFWEWFRYIVTTLIALIALIRTFL